MNMDNEFEQRDLDKGIYIGPTHFFSNIHIVIFKYDYKYEDPDKESYIYRQKDKEKCTKGSRHRDSQIYNYK